MRRLMRSRRLKPHQPKTPLDDLRRAPHREDIRMKLLGKTSNAERAKKHLFASQATYYAKPLTLVEGHGTRVRDDEGNEYLDAFAGIATTTLGYGDNQVAAAEQAKKLTHVSTLYLTDELLDYVEKVADVAPAGMTKTFVTNSGSEAN